MAAGRGATLQGDEIDTEATLGRPEHAPPANIFGRINWFRIVLDEGHRIRNPNTTRHQRIMGLRARHHLVLTGKRVQQLTTTPPTHNALTLRTPCCTRNQARP